MTKLSITLMIIIRLLLTPWYILCCILSIGFVTFERSRKISTSVNDFIYRYENPKKYRRYS